MPAYEVLKETAPGQFTPTGQTFAGTEDEAQAQLQALQLADPNGTCFAMQEASS